MRNAGTSRDGRQRRHAHLRPCTQPSAAKPAGPPRDTGSTRHDEGSRSPRKPVEREQLRRGPKKHAQGAIHEPLSAIDLSALAVPARVDLIGVPGDELAAFAWHLPSFAPVQVPPPRGSGQFQVVMAGEFRTTEATLCSWESRYLSAGESDGACSAGAGGLQLLVLQMPAKAAEYAAAL